jgi:F-type H+-transporting ATPase subunit delta
VVQVNLSTTQGDFGVLQDHVPTLVQLKPGLLAYSEQPNTPMKQLFVSGGFAQMNPDSSLVVSSVEAAPLEDLCPDVIQIFPCIYYL